MRGYEQALREYVLPEIGAAKLQELRRQDIQRLADDLAGLDISAATVRNALLPLRAICRRALSRGDIQVNPTVGIEIPAVRGRRTRFATPEEAQQALRWVDVDLAGGVLPADALVFGRADGTPFATSTISKRANDAWRDAKLRPITLHECRHTFASLMIAAGVNPNLLQTFMGHSSITVTLDRYGHLFPGSEGEAAVLLDAYLAESHERARSASPSESDCGEVGPLQERS